MLFDILANIVLIIWHGKTKTVARNVTTALSGPAQIVSFKIESWLSQPEMSWHTCLMESIVMLSLMVSQEMCWESNHAAACPTVITAHFIQHYRKMSLGRVNYFGQLSVTNHILFFHPLFFYFRDKHFAYVAILVWVWRNGFSAA